MGVSTNVILSQGLRFNISYGYLREDVKEEYTGIILV